MFNSVSTSYCRLPHIKTEKSFCIKTNEGVVVKDICVDNYITLKDNINFSTRCTIILMHDSNGNNYACTFNKNVNYTLITVMQYEYLNEDFEMTVREEESNNNLAITLSEKYIIRRELAYKYAKTMKFLGKKYILCRLSSANGTRGIFLANEDSNYSALHYFDFKSVKVYNVVIDNKVVNDVLNILDSDFNIQRIGVYSSTDDTFEDIVEVRS